MNRLPFVAILLCSLIFSIKAQTPYIRLSDRATRAFNHAEWASAGALLDLMLEQKPDIPSSYGKAIVANGMANDSLAQIRLLTQALDNHVPFDSVFSQVQQWSFHIGNFKLYEDFLLQAKQTQPWLTRTIDANLLRFYAFRSNGDNMVEYAQRMLNGAPDNIGFLTILAEGQMICGHAREAINTYLRILQISPNNYNALLCLGNWFNEHPDESNNGHIYLQHAYQLHPTPYVAKLLNARKPN